MSEEPTCSTCRRPMNAGEAKVFTVCDECWDDIYAKAAGSAPNRLREDARLRMYRDRASQAEALLRRWHEHASFAHWTDHGTTRIAAETRAFLGTSLPVPDLATAGAPAPTPPSGEQAPLCAACEGYGWKVTNTGGSRQCTHCLGATFCRCHMCTVAIPVRVASPTTETNSTPAGAPPIETWQGSSDGERWFDTDRKNAMTFIHYRKKPVEPPSTTETGSPPQPPPSEPGQTPCWTCGGEGRIVVCTAGHRGGRGYVTNPMKCRGDGGTLSHEPCPACHPGSEPTP